MELIAKKTRFRAYQLGSSGSMFSYFDGLEFTLIEARITELSAESLVQELQILGLKTINNLHITSWDNDHCKPNDLKQILDNLKPIRVECPGYIPTTQDGIDSLKLINNYIALQNSNESKVICKYITKDYITGLSNAVNYSYSEVFYNPMRTFEKSNDNSPVVLYRTGSFNVASLGDVESPEIANRLLNSSIFCSETDVLILAHHGADNGFTTDEFIKKVNPKVAICSSNYDNMFDHPRQEIRDILYQNNIPLYTTKTGDVIIESIEDNKSKIRVYNLIGDSTKLSSHRDFTPKKYDKYFVELIKVKLYENK